MKKTSRALSIALAIAMILSTAVVNDTAGAAASKAALKTKKVNLNVGKKATIKINRKQKKAVYKFVSSRKAVAAVSKKGVITAKKAGKATITVKETLKKKTRKLGKVNVTVKKVSTTETSVTQTPVTQTSTPAPATQTPVVTAAPTTAPTSTPDVTATPEPTSPYVPVSELLMDAYDAPAGYRDNVADNNGEKIKIEYPSTVVKEGGEVMRKANVCLPKDYDADDTDKRYPVIYMCHGIFGSEDAVTDAAYVYWNAIAEGKAEEAILVFPNCCANETSGSVGENNGFNLTHYSAYDNFLNDFEKCLKPYIDKHYNTLTDRNNTAICGFSMGGRVTLHLGFTLQDTFRYIGAFCPAPGIFDFSDNGVTGPGLFKQEEFKIKDEYKDDTLVMLFKGKNDGTVKQFPQEYEDALVANEVPHVFYHGMGMKSDGTAGGGGHDGDLYDFGFYNFVTRIFKKR